MIKDRHRIAVDPCRYPKWRPAIFRVVTGLVFACAAAETTFADQQLRPWRIVVNDDGDFEAPGDDPDLQKFLDRRFSATVATQVDAYFLNIASTDRLWDKAKARLRIVGPLGRPCDGGGTLCKVRVRGNLRRIRGEG